ncbi:MAG: hypothetical protein ACKVT2_20820 [Saprospiraceae bacterium]
MSKNNFLCIFALILSLGAKSQTFNYAVTTLNNPFLSSKGDAVLGIGWGRGAAFQALELQGVYSFKPHLALMANYFGAGDSRVRKKQEYGSDFRMWEIGIGAYEQVPKGAASLFGGFAAGKLFSNFGLDRTAKFALQRWFLQPGLHYRGRYFQAGLALRLSYLSHKKGDISYSIESPDIQYIQNIEKKTPMFLPELGVQGGIRFDPIVVKLCISSIFPNTGAWDFDRINSCLSVTVGFGAKREKKL